MKIFPFVFFLFVLCSCSSGVSEIDEDFTDVSYTLEEFKRDTAVLSQLSQNALAAWLTVKEEAETSDFLDSDIAAQVPSSFSCILIGSEVFEKIEANRPISHGIIDERARSVSRILGPTSDDALTDKMKKQLNDYYFRRSCSDSSVFIFENYNQYNFSSIEGSIKNLVDAHDEDLVILIADKWEMTLPELIDNDEFSPGYATANVSAVQMSTGKLIGRFTVSAENSETVSYMTYSSTGVGGYTEIDDDLFDNFENTLSQQFKRLFSSNGMPKNIDFVFQK